MILEVLHERFTICKLEDASKIDWSQQYLFLGKTDRELSLLCTTQAVPENAYETEAGYVGFRIQGQLDFSLTGILSPIAAALAQAGVPIFVVSTFDTDYLFVKEEKRKKAMEVLEEKGYGFTEKPSGCQ